MKGWLIKKAVADKLANYRNGHGLTHFAYDKIVFNKMKQVLGGKVRLMITGSAPISSDVLDFLKICFCAPICEGYGMTESCGGSTITYLTDPLSGHVGGPLQCVKIRLRSLPEMNYSVDSTPPKGEVCFYGSTVMSGYFKNPEKTAESLHDGWLWSGDVGQINPNGSIKIVDRVKNIFKTSQGEYIAPEKLENVYVQSQWIQQCWIYGNSMKDYIIGFIVVDGDVVKDYASKNNLANDEQLMENAEFK